MSGVAAMPTCRCVADNEMGRPATGVPTGEETAPMPTICSISEYGIAARKLLHHLGKHVLKARLISRDALRGMRSV